MTKGELNGLPDPYIAACTVFKNQALYLREWISFHYMLGVRKFYLYDQGSDEDWQATVADYIKAGVIEYPMFTWFCFDICFLLGLSISHFFFDQADTTNGTCSSSHPHACRQRHFGTAFRTTTKSLGCC